MENRNATLLFALISAVILQCAGTGGMGGGAFAPEPRQEDMSLLVGGVLLEVDGYDDLFEAKTKNITVVIVGKWEEDGKEMTKGYRVKTDENGYYALQNVPPGSYVVKGFESDVGYTSRFLVTSMWDGNMQRYFPTSNMIDHNVRVWPPTVDEKVIDLQITYLKLDKAGRIIHDRFEACRDTKLGLPDKTYTMPRPSDYFREKYPELDWYK